MTKKNSFVLILLLLLFTSCVVLRQKKFRNSLKQPVLTSSHFTDRFKFQLGSWILVPARINGNREEQLFILDTGSPCTYSFKTTRDLNLSTKKLVGFGSNRIDYGVADAQIGNSSFKQLPFLAMDALLFDWQKVSGLIGVNAMQEAIWELNFSDSSITVSDDLNTFKNTAGAYKVKFKPYSEQQTPVVELILNRYDTVSAFIDTGEPGFIKFNSAFDTKALEQKQPGSVKTAYYDVDSKGRTLKKKSIYYRDHVKLNTLQMGDLELDTCLVQRVSLYKGKNLIGLEFLKHFVLTFDFKHHDLYLKPIKNDPFPKNLYTYGFECFKRNGLLEIDFVYRGSLAEKLGIRCGDKLLQVNNQTIQNLDSNSIHLINNPLPSDQEINLIIKDKALELTLKKMPVFTN